MDCVKGESHIKLETKKKIIVWHSVCKVLRYQKDIKGEFLIAVSAELFIHLSFITLYNDSEMKGKTRGGERDRGVGACGLGMAGVCRALVSPEGDAASSSPLGFLFTRRLEESCSS